MIIGKEEKGEIGDDLSLKLKEDVQNCQG